MFNTLIPSIGGDEKGKKGAKATYASQQEVDAANLFAKEFLRRRNFNNVTNPEEAYVAQKAGDPVVPFTGAAVNPKKLATTLPSYVKKEDIKGDSETGYYYENNDGDIVDIEPSLLNMPRFRNTEMSQELFKRINYGLMKGLGNTQNTN